MRYWIQCVINNNAALEDFIDYVRGIEKTLVASAIVASKEGRKDDCSNDMLKLSVYTQLRDSLLAEVRNIQQQTNRENKR